MSDNRDVQDQNQPEEVEVIQADEATENAADATEQAQEEMYAQTTRNQICEN